MSPHAFENVLTLYWWKCSRSEKLFLLRLMIPYMHMARAKAICWYRVFPSRVPWTAFWRQESIWSLSRVFNLWPLCRSLLFPFSGRGSSTCCNICCDHSAVSAGHPILVFIVSGLLLGLYRRLQNFGGIWINYRECQRLIIMSWNKSGEKMLLK